jgi:hypothetical protein
MIQKILRGILEEALCSIISLLTITITMTMTFLLQLLAFLGLSRHILAETNSSTSKVYVHIPFHLHNPSGFAHVQAEFGFQHTSGSIAEYVYYLDDHLCSPLAFNKTEGYPSHNQGLNPPFILLANAGTCSAVTKARHAQQVGASALIIADLHCNCDDKDCTKAFPKSECQEKDPKLVNDGSGNDISIPSFLMFKGITSQVKEKLVQNQPVLMELVWGLPKDATKDASLALWYHLWTTAYDPLVDVLTYHNVRAVSKALKGHAKFTPRYSIIDGTRFKCVNGPQENGPCDHLCTNKGRYCTTHATNLSGHAIVKETLRRLCIWEHFAKENEDPWWEYVLYHKEHCSEPHYFANETCLTKALVHANVDSHTVEECMKDAGDTEADVANTLLDEMIQKQKQSSVVALPAITVNQDVLDHMSSWSLFESICRRYWDSKVSTPEICVKCGACPNIVGCIEEGHCVGFHDKSDNENNAPTDKKENKRKKAYHGWRFFWFIVISCLCGLGYYQYKQQHGYGDRSGPFQGYLQLSSDP